MNKDVNNSENTKQEKKEVAKLCNCTGCYKKPVDERKPMDGLCHCGDCNGYGDRW